MFKTCLLLFLLMSAQVKSHSDPHHQWKYHDDPCRAGIGAGTIACMGLCVPSAAVPIVGLVLLLLCESACLSGGSLLIDQQCARK